MKVVDDPETIYPRPLMADRMTARQCSFSDGTAGVAIGLHNEAGECISWISTTEAAFRSMLDRLSSGEFDEE